MEIDPLILEIGRDDAADSRELVERAARAMVAFSGGFLAQSREELLAGIVEVGRKLVAARPELAPLFHLVTELYARASEPADLVMVRRALRTAAVEFTQTFGARTDKVAERAAALVPPGGRVMVLGRSITVERALLAAAKDGRLGGAVVGEGRPGLEGRALATALAEAGAKDVVVTVDAALTGLLKSVDAVFLPTASIRGEEMATRVGGAGLAAAAKTAGKPAYALAGIMRMLPAAGPGGEPAAGDPSAVWDRPPAGVTVHRPRLELSPLAPLKAVVMETGPISPWDAAERSRGMPTPPWLATPGTEAPPA